MRNDQPLIGLVSAALVACGQEDLDREGLHGDSAVDGTPPSPHAAAATAGRTCTVVLPQAGAHVRAAQVVLDAGSSADATAVEFWAGNTRLAPALATRYGTGVHPARRRPHHRTLSASPVGGHGRQLIMGNWEHAQGLDAGIVLEWGGIQCASTVVQQLHCNTAHVQLGLRNVVWSQSPSGWESPVGAGCAGLAMRCWLRPA